MVASTIGPEFGVLRDRINAGKIKQALVADTALFQSVLPLTRIPNLHRVGCMGGCCK
jgi:hypothetical protein